MQTAPESLWLLGCAAVKLSCINRAYGRVSGDLPLQGQAVWGKGPECGTGRQWCEPQLQERGFVSLNVIF